MLPKSNTCGTQCIHASWSRRQLSTACIRGNPTFPPADTSQSGSKWQVTAGPGWIPQVGTKSSSPACQRMPRTFSLKTGDFHPQQMHRTSIPKGLSVSGTGRETTEICWSESRADAAGDGTGFKSTSRRMDLVDEPRERLQQVVTAIEVVGAADLSGCVLVGPGQTRQCHAYSMWNLHWCRTFRSDTRQLSDLLFTR